MIVKVQRALNQPNTVLVYNEDRSFMHQFENNVADVFIDRLEEISEGRVKAFFELEFKGVHITIGKQVKDRDW